jgi:hypothetical protein
MLGQALSKTLVPGDYLLEPCQPAHSARRNYTTTAGALVAFLKVVFWKILEIPRHA